MICYRRLDWLSTNVRNKYHHKSMSRRYDQVVKAPIESVDAFLKQMITWGRHYAHPRSGCESRQYDRPRSTFNETGGPFWATYGPHDHDDDQTFWCIRLTRILPSASSVHILGPLRHSKFIQHVIVLFTTLYNFILGQIPHSTYITWEKCFAYSQTHWKNSHSLTRRQYLRYILWAQLGGIESA